MSCVMQRFIHEAHQRLDPVNSHFTSSMFVVTFPLHNHGEHNTSYSCSFTNLNSTLDSKRNRKNFGPQSPQIQLERKAVKVVFALQEIRFPARDSTGLSCAPRTYRSQLLATFEAKHGQDVVAVKIKNRQHERQLGKEI